MDPLVFESYARPQVWGGRRLALQLGKQLAPGRFGEAWEISGHPHHVSRVSEGPLKGTSITELWAEHAAELCGVPDPADLPAPPEPVEGEEPAPPPEVHSTLPAKFPLLIKFLDCEQQLSVQVHPNDAIARELVGDELGKTEAWVILAAEESARVYAGLKEGVSRAVLEEHLEQGTVEECLHWFSPRAGDCLMLPAGTVHGVGGGVLMAEVQQSSDATFRLFDWNRPGLDGRPRPLHITESLASINFHAGPVQPISPRPLNGLPEGTRGEYLVGCRYFELRRYWPSAPLDLPLRGRMTIWMVLAGAGELVSPDNQTYRRKFRTGETVLVPATAGPLRWQPVDPERPPTLLAAALPAAG